MDDVDHLDAPERGSGSLGSAKHTFLDLGVIALAVAVISALVKLVWPRFTFWGDNSESFFPLWHHLGALMRQGEWIGFDPHAWSGSNVAAESAYGIYNPVTLVNMLLVSEFDDLALASFIVMTEFLVVFGTGVYLLARSYGANRAAAVMVGIALPFSGFTLFYEAGNWASGLMAAAWVTHFWWAVRAYTQGRRGPIAVFVTGGLAISVGNPYSLLTILVLLAAFAFELVLNKRWRALGGLVVVGLMVGAITLLTYGALLATLADTLRVGGAPVQNTGYLVPALSDLFSAGSPTQLPQFAAWHSRNDLVPSVYLSFAVVLLLPWLRWSRPWEIASRASLVAAIFMFLLMTIGPEQVWLFRWPVRLVEYLYIGLSAAFAVALSRGVTADHVRHRVGLTALLVVYGFGAAWSVSPDRVVLHLLTTTLVAALAVGGWFAYRRIGPWGLTGVAVVGTMVFAPLQASTYRWDGQPVGREVDVTVANDLSAVREAAKAYEGTVFQIASLYHIEDPETVRTGRLAFGNILAAAGVETVNRYTGLSFAAFGQPLCVDYRGSICRDDIMYLLFADVADYPAVLVDAMGVDTLVVAQRFLGDGSFPTAAWEVASREPDRTVFVRKKKQEAITTATGSRSVDILDVTDGDSTTILYDAPSSGGTILISRLAWTGYDVRIDGERVEYATGPFGLMEVEVPAGSGELRFSYTIPGQSTGLLVATIATIIVVVHQVLWFVGRARRRRAATSPSATERGRDEEPVDSLV